MAKASLYWHTLKYLRLIQLIGRVKFRLLRPKPDLSAPPTPRFPSGAWQRPAARFQSLIAPSTFLFLNEKGSLELDGWDNPRKTKLWRYNQHYFDDLNAERAKERRSWHDALITTWIADNPPTGGCGWEPYPTSLRIVNWIKYACSGGRLNPEAEHSLAIQARWLSNRIEWHLLGNHLFANAKALIHAGLYFKDVEADNWRRTGRRILKRELSEQILPDGGQFELTPMYHALALEDVLDLINIYTAYESALEIEDSELLAECRHLVPKMLRWLAGMSHPDGRISFFNDAAFAIAPETIELSSLAYRLGIGSVKKFGPLLHLADSGFVRLSNGPATMIVDLARIGPDYLPGHGHADSLSFELSLFGQRVLVNSGTSEYGIGAERLRQRGTAAHNTVTVENKNSSEVWSGFRVARRARVHDIRVTKAEISACHDGYHRLAAGLDLSRTWRVRPRGLTILDQMSLHREAEARYHLHPDVILEQTSATEGFLHLAGGQTLRWKADSAEVRQNSTTWHPEFGYSCRNTCLCLKIQNSRSALHLDWD